MTTLAVVPNALSLAEAVATVQTSPRWRDPRVPKALIELRLDRMADATASGLAWAAQTLGAERLVVTYRSVAEGGGVEGEALHSPQEQLALLQAAVDLSVAYVDVELKAYQGNAEVRSVLAQRPAPSSAAERCGLVVSHHAQQAVAIEQLVAMAQAAYALGAASFKVVLPTPTDAESQGALAAWMYGPQPLPVLAIALGAQGLWSRLLVGRQMHPPPYTLVRPDDALAVAPGQPSWGEAQDVYRVTEVTPSTQVFGVVGHPIGHSRSPQLHARAIAHRGCDAVYLPFEVPGPLTPWLKHVAQPLGVQGLSVTAPHKAEALLLADHREPSAQGVAAANTLVRGPGRTWTAHNTDGPAAYDTLAAACAHDLEERRVVVLGTGGAARAVAWALAHKGAQVLIWGRRWAAAQGLCADVAWVLAPKFMPVALGDGELSAVLETCDALVHCTTVGMTGDAAGPDACVLSCEQLGLMPDKAVVFDTVYAPQVTPLMARAARRGLTVLGGLPMLERQAAAQFALFYGG